MFLYLVRHGQSVGNVRRTFHGQTDYPLTPEGRRQARQAAEKLREVSFTRCFASNLQRAWDTAQICVAGRGIAVEPCLGLREHYIGQLEDLTREEMEARYPQYIHAYLEDWAHCLPPDGEAPEAMALRVGQAVDQIIAQGEDALLAAHNGSLSLVLVHLGLMSMDEVLKPGHIFGQGTYSAVEITDNGPRLLFLDR